MKKKMILVGAAVSLCASSFVVGASETNLNDMTQLYQYALEQDYTFGNYEVLIRYEHNGEYGYPQVTTEYLSQGTLAYEVADFDTDGAMELLLLKVKDGEFGPHTVNLEMYEVSEENVYLSAEMSAGLSAYPIEDGESRFFTFRNAAGELCIGCEFYNFLSYTADGMSLTFSQFQYSGESFLNTGYATFAGSEFSQISMAEQLAYAGVPGVDEISLLANLSMPHDYLEEVKTLFFAESTEGYGWEEYSAWMEQAEAGSEFIWGYLNMISCSPFVGMPVEMTNQAYKLTAARNADYLYIDSGEDTTLYYLCPADSVLHCVTADGRKVHTVMNNTAQDLINNTLSSEDPLPFSGGTGTIVWDSPEGLCAYRADTESYVLNEAEVELLMDELNVSVSLIPESERIN